MQLKIGELAKRAGLTIRTLHHYDAIGLLSPSVRSETGYRLYSLSDVARLHQIQAIKQLGFSLSDVREMLAGNQISGPELIRQQRILLDRQIEHAARLRDCLVLLEEQIATGQEPTIAVWLSTLELMALHGKYFSNDEIKAMRSRKQQASELSEAGWQQLFSNAGQLMQAAIAHTDPRAYALACDWIERAHRLAGGDALMMQRLGQMHQSEPALQERSGASPAMLDYLKRAFIHGSFAIFEKYLASAELAAIRANIFHAFDAWPMLVIRVRQEFDNGTSPQAPVVRQLAAEWQALFHKTYGNGNPQLAEKMAAALDKETEWSATRGVDAALLAFLFPEKAKSRDKNFQRAKVK
ncbi:MerR family transcriptional regulator [Janthinobacterium sp. 17J80-10]|uniref:MerR family transcriptional regulator n=1 Tax=Janthinobacterium sp. 17J80-10 TaxID=2497863 RepID=UPI0010053931|nr:MerR family transcriptional regulator [Janthinobacterium sp. 17J80-10]QAU34389.1 MerR family transcriptional regulator [Janthinobacterium sp. 17J80-10]